MGSEHIGIISTAALLTTAVRQCRLLRCCHSVQCLLSKNTTLFRLSVSPFSEYVTLHSVTGSQPHHQRPLNPPSPPPQLIVFPYHWLCLTHCSHHSSNTATRPPAAAVFRTAHRMYVCVYPDTAVSFPVLSCHGAATAAAGQLVVAAAMSCRL